MGSSNVNLRLLISDLRKLSTKEKVPLWKRVADDLSKPARQRRSINVAKIEQYAKTGEVIVVPGKVLSTGDFTKKNVVAAWSFSETAEAKINKTGKAVSLRLLMKDNPKGKKARILG